MAFSVFKVGTKIVMLQWYGNWRGLGDSTVKLCYSEQMLTTVYSEALYRATSISYIEQVKPKCAADGDQYRVLTACKHFKSEKVFTPRLNCIGHTVKR